MMDNDTKWVLKVVLIIAAVFTACILTAIKLPL